MLCSHRSRKMSWRRGNRGSARHPRLGLVVDGRPSPARRGAGCDSSPGQPCSCKRGFRLGDCDQASRREVARKLGLSWPGSRACSDAPGSCLCRYMSSTHGLQAAWRASTATRSTGCSLRSRGSRPCPWPQGMRYLHAMGWRRSGIRWLRAEAFRAGRRDLARRTAYAVSRIPRIASSSRPRDGAAYHAASCSTAAVSRTL